MMDNTNLESKLLDLIKQEKVIEAIKLYRENTNTGLKEAKDHVDQLMIRRGPGVVPNVPKFKWRHFLSVLLISFVMGTVFVALAGMTWPVIFNVAKPFVCNGTLQTVQENILSRYAAWGREPFVNCTYFNGYKRDASVDAFVTSAIIYSLIVFVMIMVFAIIKGKKVMDARKKGLSE
jgi:hypothetical protein